MDKKNELLRLVYQFLKENHYEKAKEAFLEESHIKLLLERPSKIPFQSLEEILETALSPMTHLPKTKEENKEIVKEIEKIDFISLSIKGNLVLRLNQPILSFNKYLDYYLISTPSAFCIFNKNSKYHWLIQKNQVEILNAPVTSIIETSSYHSECFLGLLNGKLVRLFNDNETWKLDSFESHHTKSVFALFYNDQKLISLSRDGSIMVGQKTITTPHCWQSACLDKKNNQLYLITSLQLFVLTFSDCELKPVELSFSQKLPFGSDINYSDIKMKNGRLFISTNQPLVISFDPEKENDTRYFSLPFTVDPFSFPKLNITENFIFLTDTETPRLLLLDHNGKFIRHLGTNTELKNQKKSIMNQALPEIEVLYQLAEEGHEGSIVGFFTEIEDSFYTFGSDGQIILWSFY